MNKYFPQSMPKVKILPCFFLILISAIFQNNAIAEPPLIFGFNLPWTAGQNTLKILLSHQTSKKKYSLEIKEFSDAKISPAEPMYQLYQKKIDIALLGQYVWFKGINNNYPSIAVATTGPYILVVNADTFDNPDRIAAIKNFLNDWQLEWGKTEYSFGIQPAILENLDIIYKHFIIKRKKLKDESIIIDSLRNLVKEIIPRISVENNPKIAIMMMSEYYIAMGINNITTPEYAAVGETYKGVKISEYSDLLILDADPCKRYSVIFERPYDEKIIGIKQCNSKEYDYFSVTKTSIK